jgi:hypothetical protein
VAREEPRRYPARIARTLALAHDLQRRLHAGEFPDIADTARVSAFTRARVTQIMGLQLLAPEVQEDLLFFTQLPDQEQIPEHDLRSLRRHASWAKQRECWRSIAAAPRS